MTTLTATEAYKNFSGVLHHAHYNGEVIIEKNGKPFAKIAPVSTPPSKAEVLKILKRIKARRDPVASAQFADAVENIHKTLNVPPAIKW
jgi:antitoxin (DNA-binding transcriptional repressor) of toxin-antitoxin stability system